MFQYCLRNVSELLIQYNNSPSDYAQKKIQGDWILYENQV